MHSSKLFLSVLVVLILITSTDYAQADCGSLCQFHIDSCPTGTSCSIQYNSCMSSCLNAGKSKKLDKTCNYRGFMHSPNKDREGELKSHVGEFKRIDTAETNFTNLCQQENPEWRCHWVRDWEGALKNCNENLNDGSRLACCVPKEECSSSASVLKAC